jgi:acyl-CoA synthetase (AMP-forming)/AMP-acid ligase II
MRLEHVLAGHALRRPLHLAVVCGAERVGYAELHAAMRSTAVGLERLGVRAGDRVLVCLPNGVEFVQLAYAAFTLGAIVVPVNTRLTAREVEYIATDSQPAVFAYHAGSREALARIVRQLPGCRAVVIGEALAGEVAFGDLAAAEGPLPAVPLEAEDCMIIYTSGTTGKPKGAVITHANQLIQHGYINAVEWGIGADDRYLVTTPLAHRTGLGRLTNALCLGGTLVVMDKFDSAQAVELIWRERITVLGMVPTVARMLLPHIERDPDKCSSLRRLIVTGEAFPVELKRRVISLLPNAQIYSFFAMTEAGAVTSLGHAEQFTHPASVGRPTPGVEIRLIDDAGKDVAVDEVGELLVRAGAPGRYITLRAYYNRPQETAAAIRDGWIYTGDLARRDAEGYLYIVDRKKDMVLSGGFNIYTKEVEQALLSHEAVADAAVIGVPDEVYGEAVAAFVELKPGAAVSAEALIEHCRTLIAGYKKPKHVFFVDALPRNALGKALKNELRRMAAEKLAGT